MMGALSRLAMGNRVKTAALLIVFLGVWLSAGGLIGYFVAGFSGALPSAVPLGSSPLGASAYGYFPGGAAVVRIPRAQAADPVAFALPHPARHGRACRPRLPKPQR